MTIELNLATLLALASAFVGALWTLVKVIGSQQEKRLVEKFAQLNESISGVGKDLRTEAAATRQLEKAFLEFKAELPREYVRRDDFIRAVATIETRIDNFAMRMERALSQANGGVSL